MFVLLTAVRSERLCRRLTKLNGAVYWHFHLEIHKSVLASVDNFFFANDLAGRLPKLQKQYHPFNFVFFIVSY